jgi:tRNA1(Val) A37 N6-methylase TrmN6
VTSASERPAETFLDGRVIARQPEHGYRASLDTVLLGAAIEAGAGERLVELGCGSGAALLIAAERNPGASFLGIERDSALAVLAADNARANPTADRVEIVAGDALAVPAERRERFGQTFLNPPYFDDEDSVRPPQDPARRAAFLTEEGGIEAWIAAALAYVPTRGRVTVIHRADRLADLLAAFGSKAGEIRVLPIYPRAGEPARRILVRARKGAKTPLVVLPGFVLHQGDGSWTAEARAVLEGEEGISF